MTHPAKPDRRLFARWRAIPLYLRIIGALLIGVALGVVLGERAEFLGIPAQVILQLLGALAPPLILVAVTHALMTSQLDRSVAGRLIRLLLLNTLVAICIGLLVANVVRPGRWSPLELTESRQPDEAAAANPLQILLQNVPKSLLGPLGDRQNVIGVIMIAIAFGIALREMQSRELHTVRDLVEVAYQSLVTVLHWIIELVPLGVLAIVAQIIGKQGFGPFRSMGIFVLAVLLGLSLQAAWYLLRIHFFSWVTPLQALRGVRDALLMAFSTDSSTVTMPVTYNCLKENVGLREESASLGALVGANFNNDGTALYEAMSALFVAQLLSRDLALGQQLMVVLTSILASVGAAGIPEAGLVTMTLVFTAVGLPTEHIALLLTVDWFLDRCRTTINVLGDVNVSCLLDGKTPPAQTPAP